MLTISEPKIAGLTPRWAPFPGFSLLFDAPEESYIPLENAELLDVSQADGFYRKLRESMTKLNPDLLLSTYGLCALPPSSYHVTAYDVANVVDLAKCHSESRDALKNLLESVPAFGGLDHPLLELARTSELARTRWNLEFLFDSLAIRGAFVVRLRPVDDDAFAKFVAARTELSRLIRGAHGVGAGEGFGPHVSLGYFANPQGAELAKARLAEWEALVREAVADRRLSFSTVSLHGFTSMATFYRATGRD